MKLTMMEHDRDGNVWVNMDTEPLRRKECLCHSCKNLKPGEPDNCAIAQKFFEACVDGGAAVMVTRCAFFSPNDYPASFKFGVKDDDEFQRRAITHPSGR